MATEKKEKPTEVYFCLENGEEQSIDITLPIQMLFDDFMQFVSTL